MQELVVSICLDVIAGLIGTAVISGFVFTWGKVGPERFHRWVRSMGWPVATFSIFVIAASTAVIRNASGASAVLFGAIIAVVTALFLLFRFGPESAREFGVRLRGFVWPILSGICVLLIINMILFDIQAKRRIRFVVDLDHQEYAVLSEILRGLEPRLGAQVLLRNESSERMIERLRKRPRGGEPPWDLMAFDNDLSSRVVESGKARDLSTSIFDSGVLPETYFLWLHSMTRAEDGKRYVLPYRLNVNVAYYDKDVFNQGMRLPSDLSDLVEIAERLRIKTGRPRVALHVRQGKTAAHTLSEFIGVDERFWEEDDIGGVFRQLDRLRVSLHPSSFETEFNRAIALLMDGEVDLACNWSSSYPRVMEGLSRRGIGVYSGWQRFHVLGGDCLALPEGGTNSDLAVRLIELLVAEDTQKKLASRLCWVPVCHGALKALPDPLEGAVRAALETPVTRPATREWNDLETILSDVLCESLANPPTDSRHRDAFLKRMESLLDERSAIRGASKEDISFDTTVKQQTTKTQPWR